MIADPWQDAKQIIGGTRVLAGPQLSQQLLDAPDHLAMVLARYRAAAALIGNAKSVVELGCGEGIGAGILARKRDVYHGIDNDGDAVALAQHQYAATGSMRFIRRDILEYAERSQHSWDATALLDVIEHIPAEREEALLRHVSAHLTSHGVCVIGTPNAAFEHLASPQSKAGHINLYTHDRLHALMTKHFHVVQSFGLQDTSLHTGHPDARHYLLMAGIGPR